MRLTHNMYRNQNCNLFGLTEGQLRFEDIVHNGSWYNDRGEKLGWGDLNPQDLKNIANGLVEGESFYILSESVSYWAFVTKVNSDLSHEVLPDVTSPGIDFVQKHAIFLIEPNKVSVIFDRRYYSDEQIKKSVGYYQDRVPDVTVVAGYRQSGEL